MAQDLGADLLTIAEAAKRLKVSTLTIKRWIAQGRLPAYRVGPRHIRILKRDVEAVLTPAATKPKEIPMNKERQDIWAGYDPKRVQEALKKSAGALAGIDRKALLEDIHRARKQGSRGRPA